MDEGERKQWISALAETRAEIENMKAAHHRQLAAAFKQGIQSVQRGEFICGLCWLRQDAQRTEPAPDF